MRIHAKNGWMPYSKYQVSIYLLQSVDNDVCIYLRLLSLNQMRLEHTLTSGCSYESKYSQKTYLRRKMEASCS